MEKPYGGRATLKETFKGFEITIPAKSHWFSILFLSFWLCGWFFGEAFAVLMLIGLHDGAPEKYFIIIWLIAWTAGGLFAISSLLWMLSGKVIILFERELLKVHKKRALFVSEKIYDLNEVKDIRVVVDDNNEIWGYHRNNLLLLRTKGRIKFDYGLKTIRIAEGIDEAEAKYLLTLLKDKGIL